MHACSVIGRVAFIIENMLHFTKCLVCLAPFLFSHKQLEYTDSISCSMPFSSTGIYINVKSLFFGAEFRPAKSHGISVSLQKSALTSRSHGNVKKLTEFG